MITIQNIVGKEGPVGKIVATQAATGKVVSLRTSDKSYIVHSFDHEASNRLGQIVLCHGHYDLTFDRALQLAGIKKTS